MLFLYTFALFLQFWLISVITLFVLLTTAFLALKPLPIFDWALVLATAPFIGTIALPTATLVAVVLFSHRLATQGIHTFNKFYARAEQVTAAAFILGIVLATLLYGFVLTDVGPRARLLFKHLVAQKVVEVIKNLPTGKQQDFGSFTCYKSNEHLLLVFKSQKTEALLWAQPTIEKETLFFCDADLVIENPQWHGVLTALTVGIDFRGGAEQVQEVASDKKKTVAWIFVGILFLTACTLWQVSKFLYYSLVTLLFLALTSALIHYSLLTLALAR